MISGTMRLALDSTITVKPGSVFRAWNDGKPPDMYVFLEPCTISLRGMAPSIQLKHVDGTIEEFHPADPLKEWLPLALHDRAVDNAMKIIGAGALDWVNLYRLFEIIAADAGGLDGIDSAGWAPKSKMKLFKHTANSPGVIGLESRHGAEWTQPPAKPMKLSEARALLNTIVHAWLESKTKGP